MNRHSYSISRLAGIIFILCALAIPLTVYSAINDDAKKFDQAIAAARSGDFNTALPILKLLTESYSDNSQYLFDYITVLCWAEQYQLALGLAARLDINDTPDYVLQSIADAAIDQLDVDLSQIIIARLKLSDPEKDTYYKRLTSRLIVAGKQETALKILGVQYPNNKVFISRLTTLSEYLQHENAPFARLMVLNKLTMLTDNPAIRRQQVLLLSEIGAIHLANDLKRDLIAEQPQAFSQDEQDLLDGNLITTHIAWSQFSDQQHEIPYVEIDRAISLLRTQLATYDAHGYATNNPTVRARLDLIAALYERGQYNEIIDIYQQLKDHAVAIPNYALTNIAGAYHALQEPDHARALYEKILQSQPDDYFIRISLFYCLIDLEEFDQAMVLIDQIATAEPAWTCSSPDHCISNNRKLQADIAAAMIRAYAERPDLAETRIIPLYNKAPFNLDLQQARATLQYWRNRPHQALNSLKLIAAQEPLYFDAAASRFDLKMAMMDYPGAYQHLGEMAQLFSLQSRLARPIRTWQHHNRRELNVDIHSGTSTSTVDDNRDLVIDSHLYTQPYYFAYRQFFHSYNAQSRIPEGYAHYHRLGIGLEYRRQDLRVISELHSNRDAGQGLSLAGYWTPIDHWVIGAQADSNDYSIPLRGRYNENTTGSSLGVETGYLHDESLRLDASYKRLKFSDNNIRKNSAISIQKRVIAKPHYFLQARAGYYGSSNTRLAAPYFNPLSDQSLELTIVNEWLQYRFYSDSLRHRLATSIGRYNQSGFSSKGVWSISYEQQWNVFESTELVYGLGRSQRSFDGQIEFGNWLTLRLNWRF